MSINYKNRIFGRSLGRSKKKINLNNYFQSINTYKFTKFDLKNDYILDIGSGYGETSIYLAKNYLSKKIITCDKYINGNIKLLKKINDERIENINIYHGHVYDILDTNLENQYLSLVWIFFPDPWPKKKHFKRRLLSIYFLNKIYHFLKKDAQIIIATDSISYSRSILKNIYETKNLYSWTNQYSIYSSIKDYYDIETKFYKKAIFYGRMPSLFILKKI